MRTQNLDWWLQDGRREKCYTVEFVVFLFLLSQRWNIWCTSDNFTRNFFFRRCLVPALLPLQHQRQQQLQLQKKQQRRVMLLRRTILAYITQTGFRCCQKRLLSEDTTKTSVSSPNFSIPHPFNPLSNRAMINKETTSTQSGKEWRKKWSEPGMRLKILLRDARVPYLPITSPINPSRTLSFSSKMLILLK